MLGPDDLVLCAGTLIRASLAEKIEAAAEAGFRGISVFGDDYRGARESGLSDPDLRAMLSDHDIEVCDIDPLLTWLPGMEAGATGEGAGFLRYGEQDLYAVADALGARSVNAAVVFDPGIPMDAIAEAFASVCDRAHEHGLLVHLEFLPWTPIRDFEVALSVVEAAGRENGGVMVDTWHHFRSGRSNEDLSKLPGARVLGVQLDDAPREPEDNLMDETLHRRLLPGEGDADVAGFVRALDAIGSRAPLEVEVYSDVLAALPPKEAARRAAEATRAVLREARGA